LREGKTPTIAEIGNYDQISFRIDSQWLDQHYGSSVGDHIPGSTNRFLVPFYISGFADASAGVGSAVVDASHTISLDGLWFTDGNGNPIPASSVRVTSEFGFNYHILNAAPQVVPEPGTLTLVGMGAFGLVAGAIRRRRRRN
jgi:hypothetical protein